MRSVLVGILDEDTNIAAGDSKATMSQGPTETRPEANKERGTKRSWFTLDGPIDDFGDEDLSSDFATPSPSRKR